ncbi:hypothetical protein N8Z09_03755 [Methylophilaceae bacterium]|nr:hypothetical protein [Methylophilaceae bacterium]
MLSFFSNAKALGYCEDTGVSEDADGVITFTGPENAMGDCAFAPDEYTIKIYKMALCTSAPTRPTTTDTYDISSCVDVIVSPEGQDVNLAAGSEITLSGVTRPANGSYSYGYLLMANTFGIKAKKQFTNTMHTYQDGADGNYCWTKDAAAYNSDSDGVGWSSPSPLAECGGASGTAGTYVETLDQFDVGEYTAGPISVTGGTLSADLITDANGLLVTAIATADRLFGVQTFTTPIIVTTDSSLFTVSFGVNQASSIWMTDEGADNEYDVYAIGSGPFSTFMTVE